MPAPSQGRARVQRATSHLPERLQGHALVQSALLTDVAPRQRLRLWACSMRRFWGVAAGTPHVTPFVGPALIFLASGIAGFSPFGSLLAACDIVGTSLLVPRRHRLPVHDLAA